MKSLLTAGLMCFYSTVNSPSSIEPKPTRYFEDFPDVLRMKDELEEALPLEAGTFNTLSTRASSTVLNVNKPAVKLALETLKGGDKGFDALLEALRLSGITIDHGTTKLLAEPTRDQGIAFPYWYLQILSRGESFDANLSLADLAVGLAAATGANAAEMEKALVDDLIDLGSSHNAGVRFFVTYLDALNLNNDEVASIFAEDSANTRLSSLQLGLLWLRLEAELKVNAEKRMIRIHGFCETTGDNLVVNGETVRKAPTFNRVIKVTEANNSDSPANRARARERLVNFVKAHAGLMKIFTADLDKTLVGGAPLVRTKTKVAGERKGFELRFKPKVKDAEEIRCLSALAYGMGLAMKRNSDADFMRDNKVKMVIAKTLDKKRIGFDYGNNIFANHMTATVGDKGLVKTTLIGLPQDKVLPANAKPVMFKIPVHLETEVSIQEYFKPIMERDPQAILEGIRAMEELQGRNKTKIADFVIPVKDWMENVEGKFTINVLGQDGDSEYKTNGDYTSSMSWNGAVRMRAEYNITGKSFFNPGWPSNVPVPPNMPPEMLNPSLTIMDEGTYAVLSGFSYHSSDSDVCDPCRPEDGHYQYGTKQTSKVVATTNKIEATSTFIGPISIDRKKKLLTAKIAIALSKAKMYWYANSEGNFCPGDGPNHPHNERGEEDFEFMPKQMLDLEVPFEEKDGVITITKNLDVDFDYALDNHQLQFTIPAKAFMTMELRIPLP